MTRKTEAKPSTLKILIIGVLAYILVFALVKMAI